MPENLQQLAGTVVDEIPTMATTDGEGNAIRVPRYELIPGQSGPGDRYLVRRGPGSRWMPGNLPYARIPNVVGEGAREEK
jgi:hypothetical protein